MQIRLIKLANCSPIVNLSLTSIKPKRSVVTSFFKQNDRRFFSICYLLLEQSHCQNHEGLYLSFTQWVSLNFLEVVSGTVPEAFLLHYANESKIEPSFKLS